MPAALLITAQRITEIVMLARTNGYAGHTFALPAAGGFSLIWSNASAQALLTLCSAAGQIEQIDIRADANAEITIGKAIAQRAGLFIGEQAQALGEAREQ